MSLVWQWSRHSVLVLLCVFPVSHLGWEVRIHLKAQEGNRMAVGGYCSQA